MTAFSSKDVCESDTGGVFDTDIEIVPPNTGRIVLPDSVAGYPMTDSVNTVELLDVEMDQAA